MQYLKRTLLFIVSSVLLFACGTADTATEAIEIPIQATEFAFQLPETEFKVGTPYTFIISNDGAIEHEWVLTRKEEDAEHSHDDHATALGSIEHLQAGAQASQTVTFAEPGTYEMACHIAGHYEAGMHTTIQVQ